MADGSPAGSSPAPANRRALQPLAAAMQHFRCITPRPTRDGNRP